VGGWLDGYVDGMLALAEHLDCETRTIIGPWGHYRPATGVPGPTLDHLDLLARWFGHHLRGDDNGVMDLPPLTVFARGAPPYDTEIVSGRWRSEAGWPAHQGRSELKLSDLDHGPVQWSGPQWVGAHAPFWDLAGFTSTDSSEDDSVSMHFTTRPLRDDLEILGTPVVRARVTTDRPVGLLAARLVAVDPDGVGHLISRASRNLVVPVDLSTPVPPTPGEPIDLELALRATSGLIPKGWRLRLSLSGADFSVVWPPPENFTLTVDAARSTLILPLAKPGSETRALDIPASAPPPDAPITWSREVTEWEVIATAGGHTLRRWRGGTASMPERVALDYDTDQNWTVTVLDQEPLVEARTEARTALSREGWSVETIGSIQIVAGTAFEVRVELSAKHDENEIFHRVWEESIPRQWV
jgi:hypothetical protein